MIAAIYARAPVRTTLPVATSLARITHGASWTPDSLGGPALCS
jgi:hypothetical protein